MTFNALVTCPSCMHPWAEHWVDPLSDVPGCMRPDCICLQPDDDDTL